MPPQGTNSKWDDAAERDLCVAMIIGNQEGERARYNWVNILEIMHQLGYTFTKDAMAQRFTKIILKDFKNRHGGDAAATCKKKATRKRAAESGEPEKPKKKPKKVDAPVEIP